MNETTRYQIWPRRQPVMRGVRALQKFASDRRRQLSVGSSGKAAFWVSGTKRVECQEIDEIEDALCDSPVPTRWELRAGLPLLSDPSSFMETYVHIDVEPDDILVTTTAGDRDLLNALTKAVEQAFGFARLPDVEQAARPSPRVPPHATATIGCHFDDEGKQAAARLGQFLSLLRFARVRIPDVFRSDSVPEKVKLAIQENDFYFGVVTGNRDHSWLTAESSYALAKDKQVVLLIQKGATFNATLLGADREYLPFCHSIDETFIGVLQEPRRLRVIGV